ncbi:uncharacterized PE-PGRS family protein PE_PGRS10 [Eurosta solidaginis]|uniref:uncharacterized PE-PGRS family protein PE_PGRS10 n=1 Tax=Eurosta solidaginis TaxID=178769 RepID=UPI0035307A57
MNKPEIIILTALLCSVLAANQNEPWVWSKRDKLDEDKLSFHGDKSVKYQSSSLRRNAKARDREPTTRRPIPGQPQNDDIDDYIDEEVNKNVGTRNFPFPLFNTGNLYGTSNYPNIGGLGGFVGNGNGILVGPGGPTGSIGRPQTQYPSNYPANGFIGQPGLGFPTIPGGINGIGNGGQFGIGGGGGFLGTDSASNPNFGGQLGGVGQFTGGQYPANGQYPIGGQYPGATGGAQYPVGPLPVHYPGGGPLYTEGYGLASTSAGYPGYFQGPATFGFGPTFNDNESASRKLHAEGKNSVVVESSKLTDQTLDDKINKSLSKALQ